MHINVYRNELKAIKNENRNHRRSGLHMSEYMLTECYTETIPVHSESEDRRKCIFLYRKFVVERTHTRTHMHTQAQSLVVSLSLCCIAVVGSLIRNTPKHSHIACLCAYAHLCLLARVLCARKYAEDKM